MSYRDDIHAIRSCLRTTEVALLPIRVGVDSAEAAQLIGRAMAEIRAADRLLAGALTTRLDPAPAQPVLGEVR